MSDVSKLESTIRSEIEIDDNGGWGKDEQNVEDMRSILDKDEMTGILSHRGWKIESRALIENCRRKGIPVAVFVMDLDNLNIFNDKYGHKVGNDAITLVVEVTKGVLSENDKFGRWGGDEFVITCVNCLPNRAETMKTIIKSDLENKINEKKPGDSLYQRFVSAGIGYSQVDYLDSDLLESAFERADMNMFIDKNKNKEQAANPKNV